MNLALDGATFFPLSKTDMLPATSSIDLQISRLRRRGVDHRQYLAVHRVRREIDDTERVALCFRSTRANVADPGSRRIFDTTEANEALTASHDVEGAVVVVLPCRGDFNPVFATLGVEPIGKFKASERRIYATSAGSRIVANLSMST